MLFVFILCCFIIVKRSDLYNEGKLREHGPCAHACSSHVPSLHYKYSVCYSIVIVYTHHLAYNYTVEPLNKGHHWDPDYP